MTATNILRGHNSRETAHVVDDYPYGFDLRCKIRYWLEHRTGFGSRLMSQTTNPKFEGDVWNKPKGSTYTPGMARMFKDAKGHVQWAVLRTSAGPDEVVRFLDLLGHLFDMRDRYIFQMYVLESRSYNRDSWTQWDAQNPEAPAILRPEDSLEALHAKLAEVMAAASQQA